MDSLMKSLSPLRRDLPHESRDSYLSKTQCLSQTKKTKIMKDTLMNWQTSSLFCKILLSTIARSQVLNQLAQNEVLALRFRT